MKTNSWKYSFMALAMATAMTGCNQNTELGAPAPSNDEDALNVVATATDFISSDASSRVSETDYTTTFEEGDAIGVFVVRDGEALISNMKMTLGSDNAWAGENGAKLYYYKDADYIAYSPYTEGLSVTSEKEIITHFTTKLEGTTGQSTLADYQAADLMTASVVAANVTRGQNITFNFAHRMSMIEIKVPIHAYKTNGGYEYSVPLGLKVKIGNQDNFSLCTFGKETTGETGSEVTKGIYRCIVAPSNTKLNVEGEFQDGSASVYFHAANGAALSVTPKAGSYKGIDVNYTYTGYTATRELKVGDYYYADGSIWPGDLGNVPAGCIGIIFSTETSDTDKNTHSWKNGYVIALENTSGTLGTDYSQWASSSDVTLSGNTLAKNGDLTDMDGYTASYSEALSEITAVAEAKAYSVALPENTSGWYLPSAAQLATVLNNLYTNDGWSFSKDNAYSASADKTNKVEALKAIQKKFEDVGGYLLNAQESEFGTNVSPAKTDRWWSTTEDDGDSTKAWALELKANGQVSLITRDKKSNSGQASVRPVFAF
ncbi:fimbrillin family protein [Phocaeicola plebeius]|uniref:fimbrillin family protein n=1 Tax=Phocaeicola plebeius TaxID=310297 RepID=UPI00307F18CB